MTCHIITNKSSWTMYDLTCYEVWIKAFNTATMIGMPENEWRWLLQSLPCWRKEWCLPFSGRLGRRDTGHKHHHSDPGVYNAQPIFKTRPSWGFPSWSVAYRFLIRLQAAVNNLIIQNTVSDGDCLLDAFLTSALANSKVASETQALSNFSQCWCCITSGPD